MAVIEKKTKLHDKKLKSALERQKKVEEEAAQRLADAEILKTQEYGAIEVDGMEKTWKLKQADIVKNLDALSAKKSFELKLDTFGPYTIDYTPNGAWMLIAGKKGHVATFDWKTGRLGAEIHLKETVRDCKWLHNEQMYAIAQKKYVYIYDRTGAEVHRLNNHIEVNKMDYLRYHFLLTTVGNAGILRYHDTSTGELVAELKTRMGRCEVMTQNPYNAVMNLGHSNGVVSMWTPNMTTPVVKMLCHRGPVTSIAVDYSGNYLATSGLDGQLKIWDIRKFEPVHQYYTPQPANALAISQKGMIAVAYGPRVAVWKDALKTKQQAPYMNHLQEGTIMKDVAFCPYEDVLGAGHTMGVCSLLIPGSGEASYDALEDNPFETKKQRQEREVKMLLEKLSPNMITMDPNSIGIIDPSVQTVLYEDKKDKKDASNIKEKNKTRGRSKASKRLARKQNNVIDAKREAMREKLRKEKNAAQGIEEPNDNTPYALSRFKVRR